MTKINRRSANITEGVARAPNRSMYYAIGYEEADFKKPMIGVANGHSTITPCNAGLQKLADAAVEGIEAAGGNAQIFGTPTISDGMAMGTEGMKYSLVSREVIADCVETCVGGQWMDGVLVVGGCDKNMPGGMMGILRANVPAIYVYGGTILPGRYKGQDLNIVSVFEAVGQYTAGNMSEEDFCQIERRAIPGTGSCGGMYTANTMSSAFEALGMSLPSSSTMANPHDEIVAATREAARVLVEAVKADLKPRDIVTRKSIENAVAVIMAIGGSTNAVLHFLAIAHAAQVEWTIDDFERMRQKVPVLCDLKPSGRYLAVDLHRAGGIPQVMKILLDAGLMHGDCITITGKTLAENLAAIPSPLFATSGGKCKEFNASDGHRAAIAALSRSIPVVVTGAGAQAGQQVREVGEKGSSQAHPDPAPPCASQCSAQGEQQERAGQEVGHKVGEPRPVSPDAPQHDQCGALEDDEGEDHVDDAPAGKQVGHGWPIACRLRLTARPDPSGGRGP